MDGRRFEPATVIFFFLFLFFFNVAIISPHCTVPVNGRSNAHLFLIPLPISRNYSFACSIADLETGEAMSWPDSVIPYLKVYKDGKVVDMVCLHGRDRWIAGRHADCDIWVGHASTSRRHLEIQVLHSTKELLLVDLQSAHGTRVNGDALTSASPHIVKQGDTVQMGASTRSYKVDWVPVTAIYQVSEAAASVLERSSRNGSKASVRYKLGNIQGLNKIQQQGKQENSSKGMSRKTETIPSPTRVQGLRGGRPELPPRTPVRRLPLANVQASAHNMISPQSPALRKAYTLTDKVASSKFVAVTEVRRLTTKEAQEDGSDGSASPNLWLRRCSSSPMSTLVTIADASGAHKENEAELFPVVNRECSGEEALDSLKNSFSYDEYPSDKENCQPANIRRKSLSWDGRQSYRSPNREEDGQPFAELQADLKWAKPVYSPSSASSPDSDLESKALGLPPPQRRATSAMVNNLDSLFGKLKLEGEHRCQWHVVVDTNCLLDTDTLKSLKQLESIRETRIIIPKIVLRELDGLKRRHDIGHSARVALKWIEDCMERIPFWMHVQRTTETGPSSPSRNRSFSVHKDRGLMSPTNDDHILGCALLFDRSVKDGRVILLTRDTALKIKAMAEGMTVDDATSFCESLLSPYSERFLWHGSTAHRPPVNGICSSRSNQQYTGYDESYDALSASPFSKSKLDLRSKKILSPEGKGHGKHGVKEFRCHYGERPRGLQVVLV